MGTASNQLCPQMTNPDLQQAAERLAEDIWRRFSCGYAKGGPIDQQVTALIAKHLRQVVEPLERRLAEQNKRVADLLSIDAALKAMDHDAKQKGEG